MDVNKASLNLLNSPLEIVSNLTLFKINTTLSIPVPSSVFSSKITFAFDK